MSYTALYRKFRPAEFEEVKGQEHIVTTLKNQIKANRIGHAYLFCGTRGTGKTTVAKILGKAVNCENPVDGSPCGHCASCQAIAAGRSMNVMEIDAASNNGVENIRELREEVAYSPAEGKYKVFIIDEVHMLTTNAFNALLKTLEEPPSYVIFILATTEAHKIPVTILSRCQRYDFRRITIDTITDRLRELVGREQIEADERALRYIATAADGSMRDALSLLDQCISFYLGDKLTYENVLDVLGAVDASVYQRVLSAVLSQDVGGVISQIDALLIQGRDITQFINEFIWYLRNLLIVRNADGMEDALNMSTENIQKLKKIALQTDEDVLMRYIRILSDLSNQIRNATQKRVLTEVSFIKLCRPQMEKSYDSLLDRMAQMEKKFEQGIAVAAVPTPAMPAADATPVSEKAAEPKMETSILQAVPADIEQVVRGWKSIVRDMSGSMRNYLRGATLSLGGENRLLIVVDDEMAVAYLDREEQKKEICGMIAQRIGKSVEIEIRFNKTGGSSQPYFDLEQLINMEIEIED
jgi:DNA polymerase-3 subunit gamma/tau